MTKPNSRSVNDFVFVPLLSLACVLSLSLTASGAEKDAPQDRAVFQVSKLQTVKEQAPVKGAATLLRRANSLEGGFYSAELEPNSAYTLWWMIHSHPEKCKEHPCGADDLFNPETGTSAFYAGALVSGGNGAGNASITLQSGPLPAGVGSLQFKTNVVPGLPKDAGNTVEVKIVAKTHGPVDAARADLQLGTYDGCPVCIETQFAVFKAP
jgi:hypothetical protein